MSILLESQGPVTIVTINRPERKNAMTAAMYAAMAQALNNAAVDPSVRVVLIEGQADAFSAGNDLGDFLNHPPEGEDAPVWQFLFALSRFPKPLMAAVRGVAVGVGTTMLLHCDLVYSSERASYSLPFVNLGLCPEAASSWLLPRLAGYHWACEKLMFGEPFDAQEALRAGIVNQVFADDDVISHARTRAQQLATRPLESLIVTKQLLRRDEAKVVPEVMAQEGLEFQRLLRAPAAQEAFRAFMEKRRPDFSKLN